MATKASSVLELAAAIAKGSGVDWNRVVSTPEEGNLIEELQIIERIAGIHRSQDSPLHHPANHPATPRSDTPLGDSLSQTPSEIGRWGDLVLIDEVGQGTSRLKTSCAKRADG